MNIMESIMGKIFSPNHPTNQSEGAAGAASRPSPLLPETPAEAPRVDVSERLGAMAKAKGETLNWKSSIVDLLKTLDLDSSLGARKKLAAELGYSGDTADSAKMNIWLHEQVMRKFAANGGAIPSDLKH